MKRSIRIPSWGLLIVLGLFLLAGAGGTAPGDAVVVVIPIKGAIDAGMKSFVAHGLDEARNLDAAAVILELDTHGGYTVVAEEIRDLLDDYHRPVHALVRPRAISAGAYLALAADSIYMVPAATLGAAEPRFLGGSAVDEKTLSYWEAEMKSVAEQRERDPVIAKAMVRSDIAVDGVVDKGVLLTLTAGEALLVGYSEGTVAGKHELLEQVGLAGARLVELSPRPVDRLAGWVTNWWVATILLVVGIGGLVMELLTAGFGVAGIISMAAFALYFGGHIAAGSAEYWVVLLFVFGVVMMLVEAFVPGFGIFGISGLTAMVASIVLAASSLKAGLGMLLIAFVLSGIFSALVFRFFTRRGALRHIILSEEERAELGYVAPADRRDLLGLEGVAVTTLRPSGAVKIGGQRVDVVSEGGFIPAGSPVKVIQVEGVRVVVAPVSHEAGAAQ